MKISSEIQESLELKFSRLAQQKNNNGEKMISLGLGEPGFQTPIAIIDAAEQAMRNGMTRYSDPLGIKSLRERIARKLDEENGINAKPEEILVSPGSKMALSLALGAILKPGDECIVMMPCYPSYLPQIKIAEPDTVIRHVDLDKEDFKVDLEYLRSVICKKTRVILLNFPNNPTGRMLHSYEFNKLCEVLAEHDMIIISDEIYEKLNHSGIPHSSFGSQSILKDRVITINGFSKAYSMTGWRIGYLHVPDKSILSVISRLQQHLNTNTATFIQHAALAALDLPKTNIENYNKTLKENNSSLEYLVSNSPEVRMGSSEGGLFAFMNIKATGLSSDDFASRLLVEQGVALTPGVQFGQDWDDHVRVSLAIDTKSFQEGIAHIDKFLIKNREVS